ncbi:MAG: M14 family zinc carboxypeptidase [Gemmatimonadota bacterium]
MSPLPMARRLALTAAAILALASLPSLSAEAGAQAPEALRTHAERTDFSELTPHDEVVRFYHELTRLSPDARLREIGKSREGRPILGVTLSRPAVTEPWEAHASGKPIIFIGAQVHGNEPAGKEGLMLFARDLAFGNAQDLLDGGVFVLVPQINPDAAEADESGTRTNPAGYNVNRDYARLVNPETRAVVEEMLTPWRPHVAVDAHELAGAHAYDFYALHPSHLSTPTAVREMAAGPATDAVRNAIEGAGYGYFPYHLLPSDPTTIPEVGIFGAGYGVRILRSYGGVRGAVSLLFESRRDEDPTQRIEERALWHHLAMEGVSRWAVENGAAVIAAVEEGRAENERLGSRWDPADTIVVRAELQAGEPVAYRSPEMRRRPDGQGYEPTGRVLELEVPFQNRIVGVVTRPRPVGYIIEAHRGDLAEKLVQHGLQVERVDGPLSLPVESFRVDSVEVASSPAEGYYQRSVWTSLDLRDVTLPRGGYLVRASQPMAGLAFALLEPEDIDSFASDGLYDAEIRVGGFLPVHRLRELPAVTSVVLSP